jgi:hypothetical protein
METKQKPMTPSELRYQVTSAGSHFFDRSTMKFFGDTMRNFSCGRHPIEIVNRQGETVKVYALWRKVESTALRGKGLLLGCGQLCPGV